MASNRYMLDPAWVQSIRDRHFLLTHADVPHEQHDTLNRIHRQLKQDAWELTQIIYSDAVQDEYGLIEIEGCMMCTLSQYWWELIEQKLVEGGVK